MHSRDPLSDVLLVIALTLGPRIFESCGTVSCWLSRRTKRGWSYDWKGMVPDEHPQFVAMVAPSFPFWALAWSPLVHQTPTDTFGAENEHFNCLKAAWPVPLGDRQQQLPRDAIVPDYHSYPFLTSKGLLSHSDPSSGALGACRR